MVCSRQNVESHQTESANANDLRGFVPQKTAFLTMFSLMCLPLTALRGQEPQAQPSLGDLARQVRKDKEKNAAKPKKVITDESLPSSKGMTSPEQASEFDDEEDERNGNAAPEEAKKLLQLGNAKYDAHDYPSAIAAYSQAIRIYPSRWSYYYNLGNAYGHLGNLPEAIANYQKAKTLEPRQLWVRQNLGHYLCKAGRWNEAIGEFQELLKMDPTWNIARPCFRNALTAVGRGAEAAKVLEDEEKYKAMGFEP